MQLLVFVSIYYFNYLIHSISYHSDDKVEERYRQYLLQQAKMQLMESQQSRYDKVCNPDRI